MRVAIVGGMDRAEPHFARVAAAAGHEVMFHRGIMGGRGADALAQCVNRCDVVVIVTDLNSHGAVQQARRLMRSQGREPVLLRRFGLARFAALLDELGARAQAA
jgi:Uncharacterized protein conserved in bacteria (DUF2325)